MKSICNNNTMDIVDNNTQSNKYINVIDKRHVSLTNNIAFLLKSLL